MNIFEKKTDFPVIKIIIFSFLLLTIILGYLYYNIDPTKNTKWGNILVGLVTGLIVAIIQIFLSWYEYGQLEVFKKMKVIGMKPDRDKREFYENLIRNTKKHLSIMGVTAERFLNDFADTSNSSQENAKVLLIAMTRGVKVKILIPQSDYLSDDSQKNAAVIVKSKLETLKNSNPNLEYKYFNHVPAHSIFWADDECIIGPVFPDVKSKHTPSIYLKTDSPFAKEYLNYFTKEWNNESN